MRGTERAIPARQGARRSPRRAARLALLALVLQLLAPSLHGRGLGAEHVDGPRGASLERDAGSFAAHAAHACPVCAATAQRSHALAPDVSARPLAVVTGERLARLELAPAPAGVQHSPGAPRAPPSASSFANA